MTTSPENCETLEQVRAGMDALDRELIGLIARRVGYVKAAARFKSSPEAVVDQERMRAVFQTRRVWAEEAGLDGATIELLYRELVGYCVAEEKKYWEQSLGKSDIS